VGKHNSKRSSWKSRPLAAGGTIPFYWARGVLAMRSSRQGRPDDDCRGIAVKAGPVGAGLPIVFARLVDEIVLVTGGPEIRGVVRQPHDLIKKGTSAEGAVQRCWRRLAPPSTIGFAADEKPAGRVHKVGKHRPAPAVRAC